MLIGRGLSVGYRRNRTAGTCVFRQSDGKGGFQTKPIGSADDFDEANGEDVLDFWQAQEKIKSLAQPDGVRKISPLTMSQAFDRYIPKLRAKNSRTAKDSEGRVWKHFFPKFRSHRVIDLAQTEIGNWHASLTKTSDDDEVVRRSKDLANRVLSMVKAFLNDAWQDKKNYIPNNDAWRNVKSDGERWKRSEQTRPMKLAINKAKLDDRGRLYALRHAYISEAIERNTPPTILAKNCGTSVRLIEQTLQRFSGQRSKNLLHAAAPSLSFPCKAVA